MMVSKLSFNYNSLKQFQESSDELGISDEGMDRIYDALDRFILPVPKDSPFYGTDLVILTDAFKGNLPLNGIRQSTLTSIEQLYRNICDGNEKLKILATGDIENTIKMLLTRNVGRKLIQKAINNESIKKIEILFGKEYELIEDNGVVQLYLEKRSVSVIAHHPCGELKIQKLSSVIALAHELIHVTHLPYKTADEPPTFGYQYDDLEEQLTITGYNQESYFDELNEWNVTAAFTTSKNIYYPRFGHQWINLNPLSLTKRDLEQPQLAQKQQLLVIQSLVMNGVLFELKRSKKIDLLNTFKNEPVPLMFWAILSGRIEMVQYLMEKGFEIESNALDCLIENTAPLYLKEYGDIIKLLMKNNITPSLNNIKLNEVIDYYISNSDLSGFFQLFHHPHQVYNINLAEIVLSCSLNTLNKFFYETHSLLETKEKYKQYDAVYNYLTDLKLDTSELDNMLMLLYDRMLPIH